MPSDMEKQLEEQLSHNSHASPQSFPPKDEISVSNTSTVKRKPVPSVVPAAIDGNVPSQPLIVDSTRQKALPSTLRLTGHSNSRSFLTRLRSRWYLLRRRTRFLIIGAVVAVLILIIGLSVGLTVSHKSKTQNLPLPSNHGGPYTGDLTYYDPALGSCGITSTSSDSIVAVSHIIFDAASTGSNPNENPLCNKKIRARREDKSIDLTVVDRCVGCKATDLDVTSSVFEALVPQSEGGLGVGRTTVTWAWLEDVPVEP